MNEKDSIHVNKGGGRVKDNKNKWHKQDKASPGSVLATDRNTRSRMEVLEMQVQ